MRNFEMKLITFLGPISVHPPFIFSFCRSVCLSMNNLVIHVVNKSHFWQDEEKLLSATNLSLIHLLSPLY